MQTKQDTALRIIEELNKSQQLRIERIVCSGGGAKGVVYAGSYKAMKDTGLFQGVQELSGASAGAITAAFMASGMSPEAFREQLLNSNLKELMGNSVGSLFNKNPSGTSFITKDGKPLEDFLRHNILESVKNTLHSMGDLGSALEDPPFKQLLLKLQSDNPKFTFADLALLNRHFPSYFKRLTVSAVRFPGGGVQIFNSELTPDVEIALACRASASIPVVLQPVEIELKGVKSLFVDGGLFDNLPTDYFDKNDKGELIPNQKPLQTLVIAFGEGLDNNENPVFQALYGPRWDETIANEFLTGLLNIALDRLKKGRKRDDELYYPEEEVNFLIRTIKSSLNKLREHDQLTAEEINIIINALNQAVRNLLLKPNENRSFWRVYNQEKNKDSKLTLLAEYIKNTMKPALYKVNFIEKLKRDVLIELLGDLQAPYKNTGQKEIGYQKLRSVYPLRTVELRVGDIKTTDFDQATRVARVMDSLGYLDTVNHITNHELHNPEVFDAEKFYTRLVDKFKQIYEATLLGAGQEPQKNTLFREIDALKLRLNVSRKRVSEAEIARQVYQLIKDKVEVRLDSMEAFALSRAVEFHNKTITSEQLFKETYEEGFKRSSIFSISKISGGMIFKSSTLHESLKNKNMFELFSHQPQHQAKTRTDKVFSALEKIAGFVNDSESEIELNTVVVIK